MRENGTIEAFMEVSTEFATPLGAASYRAGYRYAETGEVICIVEIAASIAESAILRHSKLAILTTPDGYIESSVHGIAVRGPTNERPFLVEAIDVLVSQLLASENLRMEEATAEDLNILLQRLERSVSLVKGAIGQMASATKTAL